MKEETIDIGTIGDDLLRAYEQGLEDGKPKWIPVSERLPEEKGFYLVFSPLGIIGTAYFGAKWFVEDSRINVKNITHWMPLLEPPKEETDG